MRLLVSFFTYEYITGEKIDFKLEMVIPSKEEFSLLKKNQLLHSSFRAPIKETVVRHYNGFVRGFRGVFWLEGKPEILQFIYDYRIGVRQGYGMVDLITRYED